MNRLLEFTEPTVYPLKVIDGTFDIPTDTEHPEFVIPYEIVDEMIAIYGLAAQNRRVIDPMAGNGSFIGRILQKGGLCDGVELDETQYELTRRRLPRDAGIELVQGDCRYTPTQHLTRGYDAIYTSVPFALIDEIKETSIAIAFNRMLKGDGRLIIDSAQEAMRNGRVCRPAGATIRYFTDSYFDLEAVHPYEVSNPPKGCDNQFTELVFRPRWVYYPGILSDLTALERQSPADFSRYVWKRRQMLDQYC